MPTTQLSIPNRSPESAYGVRVRPALPTLLALSLLGACAKYAPDDLTSQVMFTAAGSYDASADTRPRLGKGMRRVTWKTRPPLAAQSVNVDYNSDARPIAWTMTIERPKFSAGALAGRGAQQLTTPAGPALLITSGTLKNVLVLKQASGLQLMTRGYAAQQRPELLASFHSY